MSKLPEQAHALADHTAESAQRATESAQQIAHAALDGLASTSRQLVANAHSASDSAAKYIQRDPIKAVLIAAATGAALMALVGLVTRSHPRH